MEGDKICRKYLSASKMCEDRFFGLKELLDKKNLTVDEWLEIDNCLESMVNQTQRLALEFGGIVSQIPDKISPGGDSKFM